MSPSASRFARTPSAFSRRHRRAGLVLATLLGALSGRGNTAYWQGSSYSSWTDWSNWSGLSFFEIPSQSDDVVIGNGIAVLSFGHGEAAQLTIGNSGFGALILSSANFNANGPVYIGNNGGAGELRLNGSQWYGSAQNLLVGQSGNGAFLASGGETYSNQTYIANQAGVTGNVTISDGNRWYNTQDIVVGRFGTGSLSITGSNTEVNNSFALVGDQAGSSGTVTVAAARWTQTAGLVIGNSGSGSLTVSGGGRATNATDSAIGRFSGSSGTVTVQDFGSSWSTPNLKVGESGTGSLTVRDGATVSVSGTLTLGANSGSSGTLDIGAPVGQGIGGVGTVSAGLIAGGGGSGLVNFNHGTNGLIFGVPLSGNLALQHNGASSSRTILTADATHTGGTTVNAGTLQIGDGGTTGSLAGNVVIGSNGTLSFNRLDDLTFAGDISGGGLFQKIGNGALTLTGNVAPATTWITLGTLRVGNGGATGALFGSVDIGSGTTLEFNRTGTVNFSGALTGSGSLVKNGSGTLGLQSASPGFTGTTTLNAGTLSIEASGNTLGTGTVRVLGGGIRAGGAPRTVANALNVGTNSPSGTVTDFTVGRSTTFSGGVTLSGATRLVASNFDGLANSDTVFSGNIQGAYPLTLAEGNGTGTNYGIGTGAIVLSGTSQTFTSLTIASGRLAVSSNASLGPASQPVAFAGGILQSRGSFTSTRNLLVAGSGSYEANSFDNTFAALTGTGAFAVSGSGALRFSGAGTFTGTLSISSPTVVEIKSGASLALGNGGTAGTLSGNLVNNGTVTFNRSDASSTSGALSGAGIFYQTGSGTFTLDGATDNTGAVFRVNAGTLVLGKASSGSVHAIGSGAGPTVGGVNLFAQAGATVRLAGTGGDQIHDNANVQINPDATFDLNGRSETVAVLIGGGTVTNSAASTASTLTLGFGSTDAGFAGTVQNGSGTVAIAKTGSGTIQLLGNNSYTGGTTVSQGTLYATNLAPSGAISIASGATLEHDRPDNASFTGSLTGAGRFTQSGTGDTLFGGSGSVSLSIFNVTDTDANPGSGRILLDRYTGSSFTKEGAGTLVLRTDSVASGGITVSGGTLQVGGGTGASTGSFAGPVSLASGTTLAFGRGGYTQAGAISGAGGVSRLDSGSSTDLTLSGPLTFTGPVSVEGSGALVFGSTYTTAGSLVKNGSGTLALAAAASPSSGAQVNTGTLEIRSGGSLTGGVSLASGATLAFGAGGTFSNLISGAGGVSSSASSDLTLSNLSNAFTGPVSVTGSGALVFSFPFTSAGSLVKNGAGTFALAAAASPSGGTQVNAGTLALRSGGSLSGPVSLASGATLALSAGGTFSNLISGAGGVSSSASSDLTLSNLSNAFTGPVTVTGSGALVFGFPFASSGALVKNGAGDLALAKDASPALGTQVNAGTLTIRDGGYVAGNVSLAAGTTFRMAQTASVLPLANDFSGSGGLSIGGGQIILTGNPGYTGATVITSGADRLIVNNAVDRTFSSDVSGGSWIKQGTGALTYLGNSPESVSIQEGTLRLGNGGTAGSIASASLLSGTTLEVNRSTALTLPGIYNVGTLRNIGSGTLTLPLDASSVSAGPIQVGTGSRIVFDVAGAATTANVSSPLSGAGTFAKTGAGTLYLRDNVSASSFAIDAGTLGLGGSRDVTVATPVSGVGALDARGYTVTLTGAATHTGGTTVSYGTLQIGAGGTAGSVSGTIDLSANTILAFNRSNRLDHAGLIQGQGSLIQRGTGDLHLSNANTYSGGTTLQSGTLLIGNDQALGTGTLTLAGGTIRAEGQARTVANPLALTGSFTVGQYTTFTGAATLSNDITITADHPSGYTGEVVFSGNITQAAGPARSLTITKGNPGGGYIYLTGNNSYQGGTTIRDGGLLAVDGNDGLSGSAVPLTLNNGTLRALESFTNTHPTTLTGANSLVVDSGKTLTYTGVIGGSGSLAVSGAGTLDLAAANTFTGGVTRNSGYLTVSGSLGAAPGVAAITGSLLHLTVSGTVQGGAGANAISFLGSTASYLELQAGYAITGNVVASFAPGDGFNLGGSSDAAFDTSLIGPAAQYRRFEFFTKYGTSTWTLSGTTTAATPWTVLDGTLALSAGATLGASSGAITLNGGGLRALGSTSLANPLYLSSPATIAADVGATLTLSGGFYNSGALTKSGAGTLVVTSANSGYTAPVTISAGTLRLGNGGATGSLAGPITNNGTLVLDRSDAALDLAATISGSGSLVQQGSGTTTLSGANSYAGGTTLSNGSLVLAHDSALGSGPLSYQGGSLVFSGTRSIANPIALGTNLSLAPSTVLTLSGAISEDATPRSLTVSGSGSTVLSGNSSYSGGTTLSDGALFVAHDSALGSGPLAYQGGMLTFSGTRSIANPIALGQSLSLAPSAPLTLSGAISEDASPRSLIFAGSAATTLSGANTYSGGTTLSNGSLVLAHDSALGSGPLAYNGGFLATTGARTLANDIRLGGNGLTLAASGDLTLSGVIANDSVFNNRPLTLTGAGTITLDGANTFTGGLTRNDGSLVLGGSLGSAPSIPAIAGANLQLVNRGAIYGGLGADAVTFTGIANSFELQTGATVTGTVSAGGSADTFILGGSSSAAFDTSLIGPAAQYLGFESFAKTGAGTWTLSGSTAASTPWTVSAGTLALSAGATLGDASGILTLAGGGLRALGTATLANPFTLASPATFTTDAAATLTVSGAFSGSGAFAKAGPGTLVLTSDNPGYSAAVTISAGTLQLGADTAAGSLAGPIVNNGILAIHRNDALLALSSTISGSGSLSLLGSGTVTLSGNNSYTGGTTLGAGTLVLGSAGALGSDGPLAFGGGILRFSAANTTDYSARFASAADQRYRLDTNGQSLTLASGFGGSGASLEKLGAGTLTLGGANAFPSGLTLSAGTLALGHADALGDPAALGPIRFDGGLLRFSSANTTDYSARFVSAPGQLYRFDTGGQDLAFASGFGDLGASLEKSGAGTLALGGANVFTGGITLGAGTLALGHANALGASGTIDFAGGVLRFSAANAIDYSSRFATTAGQLYRLDTNGQDVRLGTSLTSSGGSLEKLGEGTLSLGAANTYSGGTVLSAGTLGLRSNGALGTGPLRITGGALRAEDNPRTVFNATTLAGDFTLGRLTYLNGPLILARDLTLTSANPDLGVGESGLGGNISEAPGTGPFRLTFAQGLNGGPIYVSGANTYTGGTTFAGGTVYAASSGAFGSTGEIRFAGGTLGYANGVASDYSARFSTAANQDFRIDTNGGEVRFDSPLVSTGGNLYKEGSGTLVLGGSSNYTYSSSAPGIYSGYTFINGGELRIAADERLPDATTVFVGDNTTFNLLGHTETVRALRLDGGTLAAGTLQVTLGTTLIDGDVYATLAGPGLVGSYGNTTLHATGTYTGETTLYTGGTLTLNADHALGTTGPLRFAGGALRFTANDHTDYSARISADAGRSIRIDTNGEDIAFASAMNVAGSGLEKTGAGTLTLSAANPFSTEAIINGGALALGDAAALGAATVRILNGAALRSSAGLLTVTNDFIFNGSAALGGDLTLSGDNHFLGADTTLVSANPAAGPGPTVLGGFQESGGSRSLTFAGCTNGAGFVLAGPLAHTGGTVLQSGSLALGASDLLPDDRGLTVSGGTFDIGGFSETVGALTLGGGSITGTTGILSSNTSLAVSAGDISARLGGSATLAKTGAGTVTLSGASTYSGGTTLSAGTLVLAHDSALGSGTLSYQGGILAFSGSRSIANPVSLGADLTLVPASPLTLSGAISEDSTARSLLLRGDTTVTLSGASTFSGGVRLEAGTLVLGHDQALGSGPLVLGKDDLMNFDPVTLSVSGDHTIANPISLPDRYWVTATAIDIAVGDRLALSGPITADHYSHYLSKTGAGTLELGAANTFANRFVLEAGTLVLAHDQALGAAPLLAYGGTLGISGDRTLSNRVVNFAPFEINLSDKLTFSGAFYAANNDSLTKTGPGTLLITSDNPDFGGTFIHAAGTLDLRAPNAAGRGYLQLVPGARLVASGYVNQVVRVTGTPGFDSASPLSLRGLLPDADTVLDVGAANPLSIDSLETGPGDIRKTGVGTLTLGGFSSWQGELRHEQGTLYLDHAYGAGTGAARLILAGGTLSSHNAAQSVATAVTFTRDFSPGSVDFTFSSPPTLAADGIELAIADPGRLQLSSGLTDLGQGRGLVKTGSGTLALFGASTWSGTLDHRAGTLEIDPTTDLGSASLRLAGGSVYNRGSGLAFAAPVTLAADTAFSGGDMRFAGPVSLAQSLTVTNTANLAFDSISTAAGTVFTKAGSGSLQFTSPTTLAGGLTVRDGALRLSSTPLTATLTFEGGALIAETADPISNPLVFAGALRIGTQMVSEGTFSGPVTLAADSTLSPTLAPVRLTGTISDGGGLPRSLTVGGDYGSIAGALILAGANTHSGGTILDGGSLVLDHAQALGSGPLTLRSGTLASSSPAGATLSLPLTLAGGATFATPFTFTGPVTLTGDSHLVSSYPLTLSGNIGEDATPRALSFANNPYPATLSGNNTFSGGLDLTNASAILGSDTAAGTGLLTLSSSTLQFSAARTFANPLRLAGLLQAYPIVGGNPALTFTGNGTLADNVTLYGGTLAFSGRLSDDGSTPRALESYLGSLTLSGDNTFSGGVTTYGLGSRLRLGSDTALGSGPLTLNGATLEALGAARSFANPVILSGTQVSTTGTRSIAFSGGVTLSATTTVSASSTAPLTFSGPLSGPGGLRVAGSGGVTLSGDNRAYTGGVTIQNSGTLVVGSNTALGTQPLVAGVNSFLFTARALDLPNATSFNGSLRIVNEQDLRLRGGITQTGLNGPLYKFGAGRLTLDGAVSLAYPPEIQAGSLYVNGTLSMAGGLPPGQTPVLTLYPDVTLGGSGTIQGDVQVINATVAPGNSPGTLTVDGSLHLFTDLNYTFELSKATGTAGTDWDLLSVTGDLLFNSYKINLKLSTLGSDNTPGPLAGFNPAANYRWTFASVGGAIAGDATNIIINPAGFGSATNGVWSAALSSDGHDLQLVYTSAIPEPGAAAALAALAGLAFTLRRRRR